MFQMTQEQGQAIMKNLNNPRMIQRAKSDNKFLNWKRRHWPRRKKRKRRRGM
jgi:hypothetical protein